MVEQLFNQRRETGYRQGDKQKKSKVESEPDDVSVFDGENPGLKEALEDNPTMYENIKQQWEAQQDVARENEVKISVLESELLKERTDGLTGLLDRNLFFKGVGAEVGEIFSKVLPDYETKDFHEFTGMLKNLENEKIADIPLTIMMADLSFLSLANRQDHSGGDNLLAGVGQAFRENGCPEIAGLPVEQYLAQKFVACRHGGDEFTGIIHESDPEKVHSKKMSIGETVRNIMVPAISEKLGLDEAAISSFRGAFELMAVQPDIDIATAHFSEAVEGFSKLCSELEESGDEIAPGDFQREFLDFWLKIADRRTNISKGVKRVEQLLELQGNLSVEDKNEYISISAELEEISQIKELSGNDDKTKTDLENQLKANRVYLYEELLNYAKKGCYNTTPNEFEFLKRFRGKESWNKMVLMHILKKMETTEKDENNKKMAYDNKKRRIVREISDIYFTEVSQAA